MMWEGWYLYKQKAIGINLPRSKARQFLLLALQKLTALQFDQFLLLIPLR